MKTDYPAADAAAAARNADDVPRVVLVGTRVGECNDCGENFAYGDPEHDVQNLSPCPSCGSRNWYKWGYEVGDNREPIEDIPALQEES